MIESAFEMFAHILTAEATSKGLGKVEACAPAQSHHSFRRRPPKA